jgi:hypothetical protein
MLEQLIQVLCHFVITMLAVGYMSYAGQLGSQLQENNPGMSTTLTPR